MTTTAITALRRLDLTALPTALRLDAVVTAANGAAYLLAAGPLADLLGLDATLLRVVGAGLLAFAAVVWLVARPGACPPGAGDDHRAQRRLGDRAASPPCSPTSARPPRSARPG